MSSATRSAFLPSRIAVGADSPEKTPRKYLPYHSGYQTWVVASAPTKTADAAIPRRPRTSGTSGKSQDQELRRQHAAKGDLRGDYGGTQGDEAGANDGTASERDRRPRENDERDKPGQDRDQLGESAVVDNRASYAFCRQVHVERNDGNRNAPKVQLVREDACPRP